VAEDIRIDPEEFDAPWMTAVLEEAGVARGARVTALEFDGYVGTGQMSRNGRFRLEWSAPEGRPATVVAKFPSDDPPTRASSFLNGAYSNEYVFYVEIAPTVRVRTPTCWVAKYDGEAERCVLVMEDLAQSSQGDQFEGCTLAQADLVIEQAVGLHAPRWGDPALADVGFHASAGGDRVALLAQYYAATVDICLERLGPNFTDDVVTVLERFRSAITPWGRGTGTPATVVHGDFRPDNFLFGRTPEAPPLAIVDWQTVAIGTGITDLAYFLGGAFARAERAGIEREIVESYRQRLRAAGVEYSADDCWRDYRWGTFHGVLISVLASSMAAQTERGDRMLSLMAIRAAQHAIDLEALDLVNLGR
jgi:hypothetical protein